MKTRMLIIILAVTLLSVLVAGQALAAGTWDDYNLTVPKLGGSSVTYNKTKDNAADRAVVCSQSIGSNYILRARIELLDNTVAAGYQFIDDAQRREYTLSPSQAGQQYHARIATQWWHPVDIQAIGKWSPDNPGSCGF